MGEIIEIENYIDAQWVRHLHLMSNEEFDLTAALSQEGDGVLARYGVPAGVQVEVKKEAGVYHFRAEWEARGAFAGTMYGSDRRERQIVLWAMKPGERVSVSVQEAAVLFCRTFARNPKFAAVKVYPSGAELDCDIDIGGGCAVGLVQCDDVRDKFLMLF